MKWISEKVKMRGIALIFVGFVSLFGAGCAGGYYSSGAYYAPDYAPYYGGYGYSGGPYYSGYDPGYIGGFVISGGHRYHRYYGGHHFRYEAERRGRSSRSGRGSRGGHARSVGHSGHHQR